MFRTCLNIGGIEYAVSSERELWLEDSLSGFTSAGGEPADMELFMKQDTCLPDVKVFETVFDNASTWGIYRPETDASVDDEAMSRLLFVAPSLQSGHSPRLLCEFRDIGGKGVVHLCSNGEHDFLYPFLEVMTIGLLADARGVLLHACCVDCDGEGYLFVGQSGAGKSTMAGLWAGQDRTRILSDDRVALSLKDDLLVARGTPWHGEAGFALNSGVSVKKIFFLRQAPKNTATRLSGAPAVSELVKTAFLPFWDKRGLDFSLEFLHRIAEKAELFELGFLPDGAVLEHVKEA